MTDHITLPRAVGKRLRKLLQELDPNWWSDAQNAILDVLDAALAEPEQKPEPDVLRRWANANDDAPETEFQRGYDAARRWVREVALPALAEPEKERAETGIPARGVGVGSGETDPSRGEAYRTPAPDATHPGYIIGSHWLETAYSRIAAGEAEADVLAEVLGERGWAKREPATDEQIAEADESHEPSWLDYRDGWRDAERFHGITKEDGK
jgi:hypothetical protein